MRITFEQFGIAVAGLLVTLAGCDHYEKQTLVYSTALPRAALEFVDNGYFPSPGLCLTYPSPDAFIFVESPEMMDSLFRINPQLDSLFPEGGSLLIFQFTIYDYDEFLDYAVSNYGDSVIVLIEVNHWVGSGVCNGYFAPYVFPFGVILQSSAQPEAGNHN